MGMGMGTDGESKNSQSECVFGDNRVKVVCGCYLLLSCKQWGNVKRCF